MTLFFLIPGKMHVFNISQCFLAEKCMIPIFSDVFSEKNACFKFLLSFSPVKIPGAKIYHYFLAEKCMFPIFLEFLSGKNPRCQNLFYFSCGQYWRFSYTFGRPAAIFGFFEGRGFFPDNYPSFYKNLPAHKRI